MNVACQVPMRAQTFCVMADAVVMMARYFFLQFKNVYMFTESYTCRGIAEVMMVRLYFSYNLKMFTCLLNHLHGLSQVMNLGFYVQKVHYLSHVICI